MSSSDNSSLSKRPERAAEAIAVAVYKSSRHDMMYVYLPALEAATDADDQDKDKDKGECQLEQASERADLTVLPAELIQRFGRPEFTLVFDLWPGRILAQADASVVLDAISTQGFYLQMPPKLRLPPTPDEHNVHG